MPLLGLGLGAAQSGLNYAAQTRTNAKSIAFQKEMWDKNRQAALDDMETQNLYNSPVQQMQRLREAGLSGNLVYGKGADQTAAMIKSAQATPPNITAPRLEGIGTLAQGFADTRLRQAQTDNADASTLNLMTNSAKTKTEEAQLRGIFDLKLGELKSRIANTEAGTESAIGQEARAKDLHSGNLKNQVIELLQKEKTLNKTDKEIQQLNVAIENAKKEGRIKELAAKLADKGINVNDPAYVRYLAQLLSGEDIKNVLKHVNKHDPERKKANEQIKRYKERQKRGGRWEPTFPRGQKY